MRAGQYQPSGCVRPDRHHPQPDTGNGVENFPLQRRAAELNTRSYASPEWRFTACPGGVRHDDDDDGSTHA